MSLLANIVRSYSVYTPVLAKFWADRIIFLFSMENYSLNRTGLFTNLKQSCNYNRPVICFTTMGMVNYSLPFSNYSTLLVLQAWGRCLYGIKYWVISPQIWPSFCVWHDCFPTSFLFWYTEMKTLERYENTRLFSLYYWEENISNGLIKCQVCFKFM